VVDGEAAERQPLHSTDHEMDQVIFGELIAQVWRQKHGGVSADVVEAVSHGGRIDFTSLGGVQFNDNLHWWQKKNDCMVKNVSNEPLES
jgi:hypothetical protein